MIEKSYSKCWLCMTKDSNCANQNVFWFKERGFCLCEKHLEEVAYKAVTDGNGEHQPCEDYISREDALMCLTGEYIADKEYPPEEIISKHIRRIKALPSVRPVRRKRKWIPQWKMGENISSFRKCSECDHNAIIDCFGMEQRTDFCPNFGADMRKE